MERREMLSILGLGAAGIAASGARAARANAAAIDDKETASCCKTCTDCAEQCNVTFLHCFKMVEDRHKEHARAARLTLDCADFCMLSERMMSRKSELMSSSCNACADACKKCADECAKFDDETMKACAEVCRRCEKSCRAMAKAG